MSQSLPLKRKEILYDSDSDDSYVSCEEEQQNSLIKGINYGKNVISFFRDSLKKCFNRSLFLELRKTAITQGTKTFFETFNINKAFEIATNEAYKRCMAEFAKTIKEHEIERIETKQVRLLKKFKNKIRWSNQYYGMLERIDKTFFCKICNKCFINPIILQCGHTFCKYCVAHRLRNNDNLCYTCKNIIEYYIENKIVKEYISKQMDKYSDVRI